MSASKGKNALRFSTLLVLSASFAVICGTALVGQNLQRILTLWGESLQMTVYLSEDSSPQNAAELADALNKNDKIEQVKFISKEEALGQFREQIASYAPDLLNDNDLLKVIPSSYQFSISKSVSANDQLDVMSNLANELKTQAGVDQVSYGQDWVQNYSQITRALKTAGIVFALVIVCSALFVISNCVRNSIYQRKDEIEVLELIGATATYIRRPFFIEGAAICSVAASIGLAISYGLFTVGQESLKSELSLLQVANHIQFLSWSSIIAVIMTSALMGVIASAICLRSLNDGWAAAKKK